MPKATLVLTTIFDPVILEDYHRNLAHYGHLADVDIIVIPDLKTPAATYERCAQLAHQGVRIECPTIVEQDRFLRRIGLNPDVIPYNSDNRRNVGFLMSLERNPDFLISIDDDNYCSDGEDYFSAHARTLCAPVHDPISAAKNRFLNICELLDITAAPVYARGYPYFARHTDNPFHTRSDESKVMINAGLWLNDPDVDGITWLGLRPSVRSFKNQSLVLDHCTWSPVNSQNTALRRELIPSYYFIRMGYPIGGAAVDRYGDIFSGYFALACAKHLGGSARFGTPIADHRRNSHNYLRDATAEWSAIVLLEDLLEWLIDARLSGSTCLESYLSLSHGIEDAAEKFRGRAWTDAARGFVHQMGYFMRAWLSACRTLGVGAHEPQSTSFRSDLENFRSDIRLFGDGPAAGIHQAGSQPVTAMAARDSDRSPSEVDSRVPFAV